MIDCIKEFALYYIQFVALLDHYYILAKLYSVAFLLNNDRDQKSESTAGQLLKCMFGLD